MMRWIAVAGTPVPARLDDAQHEDHNVIQRRGSDRCAQDRTQDHARSGVVVDRFADGLRMMQKVQYDDAAHAP